MGFVVCESLGKENKERFTYAPTDLIEAIRREYSSDKWLFESASGKRLHRVNVTNAIKNTGRELGSKLSAHSLRHSRATDMLKKGISLRTVSDHLGHADVSTTASLYIHDAVNYYQLFAQDLDLSLSDAPG